jgi:hypothetical protein
MRLKLYYIGFQAFPDFLVHPVVTTPAYPLRLPYSSSTPHLTVDDGASFRRNKTQCHTPSLLALPLEIRIVMTVHHCIDGAELFVWAPPSYYHERSGRQLFNVVVQDGRLVEDTF